MRLNIEEHFAFYLKIPKTLSQYVFQYWVLLLLAWASKSDKTEKCSVYIRSWLNYVWKPKDKYS